MTVRLRYLTADDSDRLLAWRNLPEVARWMYSDHEISRADAMECYLSGQVKKHHWGVPQS